MISVQKNTYCSLNYLLNYESFNIHEITIYVEENSLFKLYNYNAEKEKNVNEFLLIGSLAQFFILKNV